MTAKWIPPNTQDLVRRYQSGTSVNKLSDTFGVARHAVARVLREQGLEIRGQSEAERVKWSHMTAKQRRLQVKAANDAMRGSKRTLGELCRRAVTNSRSMRYVGRYERELAQMLADAGEVPTLQMPVGPYLPDIVLKERFVAVEVESGNGQNCTSRYRQRMDYLLDRGLSVLIFYCPGRPVRDLAPIRDQVVAFADAVRRNKSPRGKYGMVRRDGQPTTSKCFNLDGLARVPGF